ncbi:MAG: DUF2252 domain-containing protein [Candidatus Nanopelagicales bacterium]|nr:DUF2252 domain-containing protein [Candidatus Nanopelagicales bacterium]
MTEAPLPKAAPEVLAFFNSPRPSRQERRALGEQVRRDRPLEALAEVPAADRRSDPLALLASQEESRLSSLITLRHERMTTDAFAFLRGAALIMADDLHRTPQSGINVQLCGDAHVANFGMFASPERDLVFDLNDFDETNPGPFEWDVKRLAASLVVAGQANDHKDKQIRKATLTGVQAYRKTMAKLSQMKTLDVWFATVDFSDLLSAVKDTALGKAAKKAGEKASRRSGDSAVAKLTEVVDGKRRFLADPPLLVPVPADDRDRVNKDMAEIYAQYLATLPPDRIALLTRFSFVDIAHKVVGVGSVGTRAIVLLMQSGDGEPLILQIKEAQQSVLEPYTAASQFHDAGKRVVVGQRVMQATGDPFLGWCKAGELDFYVRQLRDMKGSIETVGLSPEALQVYARICGSVLARAHARSGNSSLIAGYLGDEETFDQAVTDFAMRYSSLNLSDFEALKATLA